MFSGNTYKSEKKKIAAQEPNPFEQSFSTASPKNQEYNSKIAQDGMIDIWVSDTSSYSYNSVNNGSLIFFDCYLGKTHDKLY